MMPKRLANGLTLLSAVVCVGSAMWVGRSALRWDLVGGPLRQQEGCGAYIGCGRILFWHAPYRVPLGHQSGDIKGARPESDWFGRDDVGSLRWAGVGWGAFNGLDIVALPLWLVPLLTAIGPVRWWRRKRESGRGFPVGAA